MSKKAGKQKSKESEVLDFLAQLAIEPETLAAYLRDPTAVIDKAGLDDKAKAAVSSGDPLRIHRSISAAAAADEDAFQKSMATAREIERLLTSDPVAAQWVQNHYYQSLMMWLAAGRPSGQVPPAPGR
jgi:hypothetical protein